MITVTVISQTIYVLVPDKTTRKFVKRHTWHICYIYHYTVRHNVIDSDICIYHKSYFIANTQRQTDLYVRVYCDFQRNQRHHFSSYLNWKQISSHLSNTNTYTEIYISTILHLHHEHPHLQISLSDCDEPLVHFPI